MKLKPLSWEEHVQRGHTPFVRRNYLESEAKFMLVGAFTALRSRSGGEKVEVSEEVEAGPEMEIQEDEIEEGREVPEVRLQAAEVEGVEEDWEMVGCEEEVVDRPSPLNTQ